MVRPRRSGEQPVAAERGVFVSAIDYAAENAAIRGARSSGAALRDDHGLWRTTDRSSSRTSVVSTRFVGVVTPRAAPRPTT